MTANNSNTAAATTTTSLEYDDDNPWQTAAQVAANRNSHNNLQHDTHHQRNEPSSWSERPPWLSSKTKSLHNHHQHPVTWNDRSLQPSQLQEHPQQQRDGSNGDTMAWTRRVVQGWHVMDGIAGLLWLLYALLLCQARHHHNQQHHHDDNNNKDWAFTTEWHVIMIFTWYIAVILLLRTLLGGIAMTLDWWNRCGLRWSSYASILVGLTWMVGSLYGFFGTPRILNWLELHYHTLLWSSDLWHLVHHAPMLLWILPLVVGKLEMFRWYMVQRYYRLLQQQDADGGTLTYRPRRTRRPWWWQSDRDSSAVGMDMDPLLSSANGGGAAADGAEYRSTTNPNTTARGTSRGWLSLGGWFGGSGENTTRDDGSVEYASISEDWASRSEEDPLWWSRDEEMRTPQRN